MLNACEAHQLLLTLNCALLVSAVRVDIRLLLGFQDQTGTLRWDLCVGPGFTAFREFENIRSVKVPTVWLSTLTSAPILIWTPLLIFLSVEVTNGQARSFFLRVADCLEAELTSASSLSLQKRCSQVSAQQSGHKLSGQKKVIPALPCSRTRCQTSPACEQSVRWCRGHVSHNLSWEESIPRFQLVSMFQRLQFELVYIFHSPPPSGKALSAIGEGFFSFFFCQLANNVSPFLLWIGRHTMHRPSASYLR